MNVFHEDHAIDLPKLDKVRLSYLQLHIYVSKASKLFSVLINPLPNKSSLLKKTFLNDILHIFTRQKVTTDHFEDVYDGELYKQLAAPGAVLITYPLLGMSMVFHSSDHPNVVYGPFIL